MHKTKSLLAQSLKIQPSQLYVRDIQKVSSYYKEAVGLSSLLSTSSRHILGHNHTPVLELVSKPELPKSSIKNAGLFHNAIAYSSRSTLSKAIFNVMQRAPWSYEGSADHLVSEAFYFHDPEDNGLELYFDRPSDSWEWTDSGISMDTLPLDPRSYIEDNINGDTDETKRLGHVHLRVGDIPNARSFYVDTLGFDLTANLGSALFVSVGGYHHHLAMNTWFSSGADKRDPQLGLAEMKLLLPDDTSMTELANRLSKNNIAFHESAETLRVNDPWNNELLFTVGS